MLIHFLLLLIYIILTFSLEERKKQWNKEKEERRRNAPDPSAPTGHTLMPERERQETLNSLKESMLLFVSALTLLQILFNEWTHMKCVNSWFWLCCLWLFLSAHRSLVTELLSLPLKADNLSVRSRRAHLECRLSEIEEAIKIFSRDKVYVKIDSWPMGTASVSVQCFAFILPLYLLSWVFVVILKKYI